MTNVLQCLQSPKQRAGRTSVHLSEQAGSEIRYQFQLLLSEKNLSTLTILRRHLYRIGFRYKSRNKSKFYLIIVGLLLNVRSSTEGSMNYEWMTHLFVIMVKAY